MRSEYVSLSKPGSRFVYVRCTDSMASLKYIIIIMGVTKLERHILEGGECMKCRAKRE